MAPSACSGVARNASTRAGEKVYPEEVEEVLKAHPDVEDAVVVGVADERWGHRVVAVVAPAAGRSLDDAALRAHCRASLAGYKVPRAVIGVDAVQRSPAGKADYRWAARLAAQRDRRSPTSA